MRLLLSFLIAFALELGSAQSSSALPALGEIGVLASNASTDFAPGYGPQDDGASIATDGAGAFIAIWVSHDDSFGDAVASHLLFSRSIDGGRTWSAAALIALTAEESRATSQTGGIIPTDIAYSATGTWIATWMSFDSAMVARSTDAGVTWSVPTDLDSTTNNAGGDVSIAGAASGTWVVIWQNRGPLPGQYQLYFSRSTDDGQTWSQEASFPSEAIAAEGGFSNSR